MPSVVVLFHDVELGQSRTPTEVIMARGPNQIYSYITEWFVKLSIFPLSGLNIVPVFPLCIMPRQ